MHDFITIENPKQMKKQIFATKMMVALLTWLFISISCSKKNDILMVEQPSAEQQKKVVDRFLNAPDNVSKELNYIIDNIRKTEEKTPFLYAFAQRNGFPNWQNITGNIPIYAPEYNKQVHVTDVATNAINSNQISNPNSTATLFIPLQDTVTKEIKAYIYCQKSLDGTVTYKTYNKAAILQTPPSSKNDIKTKGVILSVFAHFEKSINHKNELQLPAPYNYTFKDVVVSFSNNKTATENSDIVFDEGCKDGEISISMTQFLFGFPMECSPILHFTIVCQNGTPMNIPPHISYPCAKSIEPGGGGGGSSTPPPSNGGSTPPPSTSTTPPPSSGGGGGWLGFFPTPPPTNTPPSYVDPNLGGGSNTSPSYPNNPSLPPNWEEDPNEPWFPVGRTPVNGIQPSSQLQYLIDNLQLNDDQIEWLNQHPVFTNELYQEFIAYTNINGQSDELISATKALIDIMINGEIDNPFSAQSFSYIAMQLPVKLTTISFNDYEGIFNNQFSIITNVNPTIKKWIVYWFAILNSNNILNMDWDIKDLESDYTTTNYDHNTYIPFDFQNQQLWKNISNVIPTQHFVGYDKQNPLLDDCLKVAKAILSNMGYSISGYSTNQTIVTYSKKNNFGYSEENTKVAVDYILKALSNGKPVIVGVECKDRLNSGNSSDETTDHFIIINGSGQDADGPYFTYIETDTKWTNQAYYDKNGQTYKLRFVSGEGLITDCNSPGCDWGKKVTQIRKTKP